MPIAPSTGGIAADVTDSTSATLTDTGITFPVASGRMYWFRCQLPYTTAATTTGLAVAVDVPASPTFLAAWAMTSTGTSVGTSNIESATTNTDAGQITFTTAPGTSGGVCTIEGWCQPSTSGEIKFQFNTEVNSSAVTIKKGAFAQWRDCAA